MGGRKHLKLLLADDDKPIANLYRTGLHKYFGTAESLPVDESANEFFGGSETAGPSVSVTVCSQGASAVEKAQEAVHSGQPFDVIVLDIRMPPGMNGVEAAGEIRSVDEDVPIIFVSGYSDFSVRDLQEHVPPPSRMSYMEKPITLAQLADRIREVTAA